jgi:UDP-glucose 4-epimerase
VPTILGFDPRYQFIHEDDMAGALEHAVRQDLDGIYNCAADGVLVLSEVLDLLGKQMAPILPPIGTGLAAAGLRRLGIRLPPEMLNLLRFGRGLDNRKLKATGYRYTYTTREAILRLREHQRLAPLQRAGETPYRYEKEVEEFLRYSPSVRASATPPEPAPANLAPGEERAPAPRPKRAPRPKPAPRPAPPTADYDDLEAEEVIALLPSLEAGDLGAVREYEAAHGARASVLGAIDSVLARQRSPA